MTDDTPAGAPDQELLRSVWDEARDLVKRLEGTTVQRFKVAAGDTVIEIERGAAPAGAAPAPVAAAALDAAEPAPGPEVDGRHRVLAPLVGTFYRASQPGAKPFVELGDVVDASQTVAIVEAMKVMNQVPAGLDGKVAEIVVVDGDWVEFEQVLMYLEPAGDD